MANDNNIQTFSAADIEKYHRGLLSARQMHDMEKAALDDPFLADALEGYSAAGVNAVLDIAELKERLAEKTETAKVIPMITDTDRRKAFPWMKVAAAVVIIAGSALLANQFLFNKKSGNDLAQLEPVKKEEIRNADSSAPTTSVAAQKDTGSLPTQLTADKKSANNLATKPLDQKAAQEVSGGNVAVEQREEVVTVAPKNAPVISDFQKDIAQADKAKTEAINRQKELAKVSNNSRADNAYQKETNYKDVAAPVTVGIQDSELKQNRSVAANKKAEEHYNYSNTFRGRITDANNVGVPFANVTNQQDNVGTYTDARGFFNLTSPDSVLNVQVRSIGFENNNVQLRNNIPSNQIILQDDRSLSEVVISQQKPNTEKRSRDQNVKMEESEPADGWDKYDAYLANNLKAADEFKPKQTNTEGSVEVSFEIDKNGEPTNFKIEKSLCSKCDKEAIRLIKEGPKWKRTADKKGRTNVIIKF